MISPADPNAMGFPPSALPSTGTLALSRKHETIHTDRRLLCGREVSNRKVDCFTWWYSLAAVFDGWPHRQENLGGVWAGGGGGARRFPSCKVQHDRAGLDRSSFSPRRFYATGERNSDLGGHGTNIRSRQYSIY